MLLRLIPILDEHGETIITPLSLTLDGNETRSIRRNRKTNVFAF